MTKRPAPAGFQRLLRGGFCRAPLGRWPLAAFLSVVPGAKNVSTDSLYNEHPPESYFAPLTSAGGHFLVMIVRSAKRKMTAVPAPTAMPAIASARRTSTVTPRIVAATIASATSVGAGRGLVIAEPLSVLPMWSSRSSHAV